MHPETMCVVAGNSGMEEPNGCYNKANGGHFGGISCSRMTAAGCYGEVFSYERAVERKPL